MEVAKKGTYVYWFEYKDALGKEQITAPARFKGRSADLNTSALGAKFTDAKLYVMDKATGNMAVSDYASPPAGEKPKAVKLKASDFEFIRSVRLRVVSEDGAPLESAIVSIVDGEGSAHQAVVTPADDGAARFEDVASGEISVKVKAEGATKTVDSDITVPEKRKTPFFEEDVRVAGDVHTLPVRKEAKTSQGKTEKPASGAGGSTVLFQSLAALAFVIVVIAIAWAIIKSKGITAQEALKKMGVSVPEEQQAGGVQPGPAVDPNMCPFCGQRKDASGNCACSVTPGASPFGAPAPAGGGGPRLIAASGPYAGQIFNLAGPSTTIGRETGEIVLPNDSTVSRRHATLTESGGQYTVRDEGSSNGTFVNGAKITEHRLTPGDEVQIGGTRFRFEV